MIVLMTAGSWEVSCWRLLFFKPEPNTTIGSGALVRSGVFEVTDWFLRSEGKPRNGLFAKRLTGLGYIVIEAGPYLYGSEALKT